MDIWRANKDVLKMIKVDLLRHTGMLALERWISH